MKPLIITYKKGGEGSKMIKLEKLAIASALIASLTALVACEDTSVEAAQEQRITFVEETPYGDILCDNRTGVVYFAHSYPGGICVMVDQNGQPLVMEERE